MASHAFLYGEDQARYVIASGSPSDVLADAELLQLARKDAIALVKDDAGLRRPEHAALRRAVLERYGKTLDLAEIG